MLTRKLPPELANQIPLIDSLSSIFGEKNFEFVLHDFRYPDSSLVYLKGNVTGRTVGALLTDRLLQTFRREGNNAQDILNLKTRIDNGNLIKTSTIFFRNAKGEVIGGLGININITAMQIVTEALNDIMSINSNDDEIDFAKNVTEILQDILDQSMAKSQKPSSFFTKEERLELVKEMEERGLFLIKGAVEEVARRLNVSRYTIYNYLDEARGSSGLTTFK